MDPNLKPEDVSLISRSYSYFDPQNFKISDFDIGRVLGRGRYGNVFVAKYIKDGMIVALKIMNKNNLVRDEYEP